MTVDQLRTKEADALAQMVAAYLAALTPRSGFMSEIGRRVLEDAYRQFLASSGETLAPPLEEDREVSNG